MIVENGFAECSMIIEPDLTISPGISSSKASLIVTFGIVLGRFGYPVHGDCAPGRQKAEMV